MSGFAGVCSISPLDRDWTGERLAAMGRDITYVSGDLVDLWSEEHLRVVRVHHGVLSPERQPIFNEDGSLCIVMDGEVFDYERDRRSLENRGHRFRFEENDAEYCLHLYEEYGTEGLARLNGSFLLALYNRKTRELLLVNDRFSSRPLYYHHQREQLVFGSQLRPVLRLRGLPRRLDMQAVFEFFTFQHVLWDRTFYQDVKALPPASILRFRNGRISFGQYWKTRYRDEARPESYYVEALAHSLETAVRRKTRGSHRLGILLSGGLDSRLVVAGCRKPLTAFTFGDFENREVRVARRIARAAGFEHVFLKRAFDHYLDLVEEAVDIGDGMARCDHAHALGLLGDIRQRCDVLLDAFGFDVRLKGYYFIHKTITLFGRSIATPLLQDIVKPASLEVWKRVPSAMLSLEPSRLFNSPYESAYKSTVLASVREMLERIETEDAQNLVESPAASSFRSISAYLLVLSVRSHMEQRSIVFDNDLLELSLAMPSKLRARGRVLRKALRQLSPELAAITNADTRLPAGFPVGPEWLLVGARKALRKTGVLPRPYSPHPAYGNGSWPNMAELIRHNEKLKRLIQKTLHDPECIDPSLFDVRGVDDIFQRHISGERNLSDLLFLLLTFGRWHKKYGPV